MEVKQFGVLVAFELFDFGFEGLDLVGERFAFVFPKVQQLSMFNELVTAHTDVTLITDPIAFPDKTTDPEASPWIDFQALSEHENVAVMVSSLHALQGSIGRTRTCTGTSGSS